MYVELFLAHGKSVTSTLNITSSIFMDAGWGWREHVWDDVQFGWSV